VRPPKPELVVLRTGLLRGLAKSRKGHESKYVVSAQALKTLVAEAGLEPATFGL
jgi:hypothetical protein